MRRGKVAAVAAALLVLAGCQAPIGTSGGETSGDMTSGEESPTSADGRAGGGILVAEGPHRFSEIDWEVVGIERRADGPGDDGEDIDPGEDFVYADVDVWSAVPAVEWTVPYSWVQLATPDGVFTPLDAMDRGTGDGLLTYVGVAPNRTEELTVVFAVDADEDLDGAWLQVSQQGYEPTALGGPLVLDEAVRVPVSVDNPVYDGPFALDEARIEIVDAWVSRELGTDEAGSLLDAHDDLSRRPATGTAHLIVAFDVTCRQIGISVGGCGVSAGQVVVDGTPLEGEVDDVGAGPYDATARNWAVYPIPVDALEAVIEINGGRTMQPDVTTAFAITDLEPLRSLTTPRP